MEKQITLNISTTYETLGELNPKTKQIWIVCHGYGQLAKYFIRRFDVLDATENYVVAPQGLAKFYLDAQYNKVGACWLTKENREIDLQNQLNYIDEVWQKEIQIAKDNGVAINSLKINVLGFSQGCAAACRWAVSRKINFANLIIWAGFLPKEITQENLSFIGEEQKMHVVIGKNDEFYTLLNFDSELDSLKQLIPKINIVFFEGEHEVKREVLKELADSF
jgi:predicted esterase